MHIGLEVKKDEVHIVYVSGSQQALSATRAETLGTVPN